MYIDLILIINFIYDFLLLLSVNVLLKRGVSIKRLLLCSLLGSVTVFILFFSFNNIELILIKSIISILLLLITFGFRNVDYLFYNALYFYVFSIILGGFIYFLRINLLNILKDDYIINSIVLIIISPIILYIYIRSKKRMKNFYDLVYEMKIVFKNNEFINCNAYLDTGLSIKDNELKNIIIINEEKIKKHMDLKNVYYVKINTVNRKSYLKCMNIKYIEINKRKIKKVSLGLTNERLYLEGVDALINTEILEGK